MIRCAARGDAPVIAELLAELGYPAKAEAATARLVRLLADDRISVLVAEDAGAVVGLATVHLLPVLHEEAPRAQLTALVVAKIARGRGFGRMLVRHAEQLALSKGTSSIVVTTANHRVETHHFYDRLGYAWTGRRYAKQLRDSGSGPDR